MTLALYARRKRWPLEGGVTVELRHARIYAEDCADCETKDPPDRHVDLARRVLSHEQLARLLEIAAQCLCTGPSRLRS